MADLLIRGMEMPERCCECRLCADGWCYALDDHIARLFDRPDRCPLVEIPDHGDLIDRAELLRSTPDVALDAAWYGYAEGYSEDAIMNVRPIIPASKEGGE